MLTFGDIEIEQDKFYSHKKPIRLEDVDINNVLVSNKISSSEKTINTLLVISMMIINKVKPLHIILPKTSPYFKSFDGQIKWMYFLIEDDNLLKKYNSIWDKVITDIKKNLIENSIAKLSTIKIFWKPK